MHGCYWLSIALHVLAVYCVVDFVTASTESLLTSYDDICVADACANGECYVVGDAAHCDCGDVYTGDRCEDINLKAVELIVIGSMVIFRWPHALRLKNYSFIYYCLDDPQMTIMRREITFADDDNSVLVGNFRDGVSLYRVCVDTNDIADLSIQTQSTEHTSNCINVSTAVDYHSLVGWFLAALCAVAAVTLVYLQKDKIELLYFHRAYNLHSGYHYNVEELIRNEKLRKENKDLEIVTIDATGSNVDVTTVRAPASHVLTPNKPSGGAPGATISKNTKLDDIRLATIADVSTS